MKNKSQRKLENWLEIKTQYRNVWYTVKAVVKVTVIAFSAILEKKKNLKS